MKDPFYKKGLSPMLLGETSQPFDSDNYLYELKLDGIRCLAYLDPLSGITELRNKRDKNLSEIFPELSKLHLCANKKCIIDGELICTSKEDGKPNFYEVQRRALMTDKFKISLAAEQKPCSYVVYDILYFNDKLIIDLPLTERKQILSSNIIEKNNLFISQIVERNGVAFYNIVKANDLEGIVAKLKTSRYYFGKRSKEWLKIKVMQSEDLVVAGYVPGDLGHVKDLKLAYYDDGVLKERGRVGFGLSRRDNETIIKFAQNHRTNKHNGFRENGSEVWLLPQLVVEIQYMQKTENGGMRQPVFRGFISDKPAENCIMKTPLV